MSEKLTKAALQLLERAEKGEGYAQPHGAAVSALLAAGYVEWDGQAGPRSWWLTITPAGRLALQGAKTHG